MDQSPFSPTTYFANDTILISLVKQHPELYDPRDAAAFDYEKKHAAWRQIAEEVHQEEYWCISRWTTLKNFYLRMAINTSSTVGEWRYQDSLNFLQEIQDVSSPAGLWIINSIAGCVPVSSSGTETFQKQTSRKEGIEDEEAQFHSFDEITEKNEGNQFGGDSTTEKPPQLSASTRRSIWAASHDCETKELKSGDEQFSSAHSTFSYEEKQEPSSRNFQGE